MTSCTVVLSGKTSELEANFFPPIPLEGDYVCGLIDFQSYMSIPNITSRNNRLYYYKEIKIVLEAMKYYTIETLRDQYKMQKPHATEEDITLFETSIFDELSQSHNIFRIETNENLIEAHKTFSNIKNKKLHDELKKIDEFHLQTRFILNSLPRESIKKYMLEKSTSFFSSITVPYKYTYNDLEYLDLPVGSYELEDIEKRVNDLLHPILEGFKFTAHFDKVTLKCILHSTHRLFGRSANSVATILGFDGTQILPPLTHTTANSMINIMLVNVIKIECNIISGSYSNGVAGHTLHEFYPTVGTGYKIVEVPSNVIYLPVTARLISSIRVRVVDQDGNLIDFRGETITLRLHIRRLLSG